MHVNPIETTITRLRDENRRKDAELTAKDAEMATKYAELATMDARITELERLVGVQDGYADESETC